LAGRLEWLARWISGHVRVNTHGDGRAGFAASSNWPRLWLWAGTIFQLQRWRVLTAMPMAKASNSAPTSLLKTHWSPVN